MMENEIKTGGPQQGKIFARVADVMESIEAVGKDSRNKQQGYKFRSIDQMYNMIHPRLAKARIFSAPEILSERSEERETKNGGVLITRVLKVRFRFYTDDGSYIELTTQGEGMDSGDKSSNKAMTAAHKYAMIILFAIPTSDGSTDGDYDSPEGQGLRPKNQSKPARNQASKNPPPRKVPMLADSPKKVATLHGMLALLPEEHHYSNIKPETLTEKKEVGLHKFLKLYHNISDAIEALANREDITGDEIIGFKMNLSKCKTTEDLMVLAESMPKPERPCTKEQEEFIKKNIIVLDEGIKRIVLPKLVGQTEPFTYDQANNLIRRIKAELEKQPETFEEQTKTVYEEPK